MFLFSLGFKFFHVYLKQVQMVSASSKKQKNPMLIRTNKNTPQKTMICGLMKQKGWCVAPQKRKPVNIYITKQHEKTNPAKNKRQREAKK